MVITNINMKFFVVFILIISFFSCRKEDTTRKNSISYSVSSELDLPLDTASRMDVYYLNENETYDTVLNVHRFNYSFEVMGEGTSCIKAVSKDSINVIVYITHNGIRQTAQKGLMPESCYTFK